MKYESAIILIRTDTTLDLSQKAEKGMRNQGLGLTLVRCGGWGANMGMMVGFSELVSKA